MTTWPRCTQCKSRLNSWTITVCHGCAKPVAAQPKTRLHLVKSDEADQGADTPQPASDHTDLEQAERRAGHGF